MLAPCKPAADLGKSKEARPSFLTGSPVEKIVTNHGVFYTLYVMDAIEDHQLLFPKLVEPLLTKFSDIVPEEIPPGLPPMRNIQHCIDLIPGASLPNKVAY